MEQMNQHEAAFPFVEKQGTFDPHFLQYAPIVKSAHFAAILVLRT